MTRSTVAVCVLLGIASLLPGCSVHHPSEASVTSSLHIDVAWLADDARQGRGPDTPGLAASSEYIANRFRTLGLRPLPTLGTYFDAFNRGVTRQVIRVPLLGDVPAPSITSPATRAGTAPVPDAPAWNVVGLLPGRGPHANEYIVVGAHYDHLGLHPFWPGEKQGSIHNGADDNASGTATMLALAERFAHEGPRDRSIVFVAFTLEEKGLVGSHEFVHRHVLPNGSIVAMMNLDMVGRLKNQRLYVAGGGTAKAFEAILRNADARSPIQLENIGLGGGGPSDHASFDAAKIPSIFLFTGLHPDYHRPSDDTEKVNFEGLAQIVSLAGDVVEAFCTMDRPTYDDTYDSAGINVNVQSGDRPTTRPATAGTQRHR